MEIDWARLGEHFYSNGKSEFSLEGLLGNFLFNEGYFWKRRWVAVKEEIENLIKKKNIRRILDLGCGSAWPLRDLNKRYKGLICVGIDKKIKYLNYAKQKAGWSILLNSFLENLPLRAGSFDLIYSIAVLEYVEKNKVRKVLETLSRIAPNLIITFTSHKFKKTLPYKLGLYHLRYKLSRIRNHWFASKEFLKEITNPISKYKKVKIREIDYTLILEILE